MTKDRDIIATIKRDGMEVDVAKVSGLTGYMFVAVGFESIALAVELAVTQTHKGIFAIDSLLRQGG